MDSRLYLNWVNEQLEKLYSLDVYHINDPICSADYYNCLQLQKIVGSGGTAVILEARVTGKCAQTIFPVPTKYPVAVKLCSAEQLDQLSCRSVADEIKHMLQYSCLHAMCICTNFLLCFGYGVNCCLLISMQELDSVKPQDFKNRKLLGELGYNIDYYIQDTLESGCDTFIVTNLLTGPDLSKVGSDFLLTGRQSFELVYSLLCSVIFLGGIPGDRHLDNYMLNDTKKGLVISLGESLLHFRFTMSFMHIDYQVLRPANNVRPSDLGELQRFIAPEYKDSLQSLLSSDADPVRKVYQLANVFSDMKVSSMPRDENQVYLVFNPKEQLNL